MQTSRNLVLGALAVLSLTACSVWQNESRKYMEKSSYTYAGLKVHEQNFVGCGHPADSATWTVGTNDGRGRTLTRQVENRFELRVEPAVDGAMSCDYTFSSDDDRAAGFEAAITHALDQIDAP